MKSTNKNKHSIKKCILPYCKECKNIYPILIIVVVVIVLYYFLLKNTIDSQNIAVKDAMNKKVFTLPFTDGCCSWWPISHFLLYLVLGMFFPDCGIILMSLGVGWEFLETWMGKMISEGKPDIDENVATTIDYKDGWWAGSMTDIVANFLGFVCGWFISKKLGFKFCLKHINSGTTWCKK